jgi:hypothetical protein
MPRLIYSQAGVDLPAGIVQAGVGKCAGKAGVRVNK